MKPLHALQRLVRETAESAVMPHFLQAQASRKADGGVFSQADLAAQEMLVSRLPEIVAAPVLGEEMDAGAQRDLWARHSHSGLWVIDPIDGTNNFLNGLPHFAVSAAYVAGGVPHLGVVFNPAADEMFSAEYGGGAFLNRRPLPLRRTAGKTLREALAGVDVKRLRSARLAGSIANFPPFASLRAMGSSTLDWCYLAAGRYDVYLHGGQNLWDYAAGALIFTETGGCLATLEGDDFWSGRHTFKRSAVAAGDAELFGKWLGWIRQNQ